MVDKLGTVTISIDRFKYLENVEKAMNENSAIVSSLGYYGQTIRVISKDETLAELIKFNKELSAQFNQLRIKEIKLESIENHWLYRLFAKKSKA